MERTKEFIAIYESINNSKILNNIKQFYLELKNVYEDKMKILNENFKYQLNIQKILDNPVNNSDYYPKIKEQD